MIKVNKKLNTNILSQSQLITHFYLLSPQNKKKYLVQIVQQLYQNKRQTSSLISLMQQLLQRIQNPKHNSHIIQNFLSQDTKISKKLMLNNKIKKLYQQSSLILKQKPQVKSQNRVCCEIEKQIPQLCKLLQNMKDKKQIVKYQKCKFLHSQELYVKISQLMEYVNFRNFQQQQQIPIFQKKYSQRTKQTKYQFETYKMDKMNLYSLKRNIQKVTVHAQVQTQKVQSQEVKFIKMMNNQIKQYQKSSQSNYNKPQKKIDQDLKKIIQRLQKNNQKKIIKQIVNRFPQLPSSVDDTIHDKLNFLSESLQSMNNKYRKIIQELKLQNQNLILSNKHNLQNISNSLYFCQSDIIPFNKQEQQNHNFLISSIKKWQKMQPKQFKILYKYRPKDIASRKYFDYKQKLLFIVHLYNNIIIGAYSQLGFSQQNSSNNHGFLFSITQKQQYHLAQRFKTKNISTYDDCFIKFGNSDIRIKIGQDILYSNFGCEMSYVRGYKGIGKINDFIGCGSKRQAQIKSYQFYQVIF